MWLAEFCSASEYSIFDEVVLKGARGFAPRPELASWGRFESHAEEVALGVDPARGGPKGDDCAVAVLIGRKLDRIFTLPPGDEMNLAAVRRAAGARELGASDVIIEAAGLGHGVYARVRELLNRTRILVKPFVGAKKAHQDPNAANQKAEVVLNMRSVAARQEDRPSGWPGVRQARR